MIKLRVALQLKSRSIVSDAGIGLVEVLVAMMVFTIIAIAMAYSMASMSRMTSETSSREIAANLAAAEIDRVQSIQDAFSVGSSAPPAVTIDGTKYYVKTTVEWVSTTGATGNCGSGGGNLQYKAVNVAVTWDGMYLNSPVRADTALAPGSRINDPAYGTILVSVLGVDGTGRSGVTVRVTPVSGGGGLAITDTIDPTDADGCSYILKVAPGSYKIEVEKSGYIDVNQVAVPSVTQAIVAGNTTTASFQYENAGSFGLRYAANSTSTVAVPSNLDVTFYGGVTNFLQTTPASPVPLHPFSGGYQAAAGNSANCANVDPDAWNANATMADGLRAPAVAAPPGNSAAVPVPMGVLSVAIPASTNSYVTAVQQVNAATGGNPGCATAKTYTFSTQYTKGTTQKIALPYGTWKLYTGTSVGATTTPLATGVTVLDSVVSLVAGTGTLVTGVPGASVVSSNTVTLDPRPSQ